jgi:hypothetical protein
MSPTLKLFPQIWPVMLLLAAIAPTIRAQGTGGGIGNTTSTPVPGVPHDYITGLNEIVNPANGSLSVRINQYPTSAAKTGPSTLSSMTPTASSSCSPFGKPWVAARPSLPL